MRKVITTDEKQGPLFEVNTPRPDTTITSTVQKKLGELLDGGKDSLEQRLRYLEDELTSHADTRQEYERELEELEGRRMFCEDRVNTLSDDIEVVEGRIAETRDQIANYTPADTAEKKREVLAALKRLRFIERVQMRGGKLTITTHPIFCQIRTGDGSRTTKRRLIGVYRITLNPNGGYANDSRDPAVLIENVLFTASQFDHWAVRNGVPCWGAYKDTVRDQMQALDYPAVLETILSFLLSTDDGGAWRTSHNWLNGRTGSASDNQLAVGERVYVNGAYDNAIFENHLATVRHINSGASVAIETDEPFYNSGGHRVGHNSYGHNYTAQCWNLPVHLCTPVGAESTWVNPLDTLDAAPAYTPLTTLLAIMQNKYHESDTTS